MFYQEHADISFYMKDTIIHYVINVYFRRRFCHYHHPMLITTMPNAGERTACSEEGTSRIAVKSRPTQNVHNTLPLC